MAHIWPTRIRWRLVAVVASVAATVYVLHLRYIVKYSRFDQEVLLSAAEDVDFSGFDNAVGAASPIVPNIIHFVKLGNESGFSFIDIVCLRAAWLAQRPRQILVHCDHCDLLKKDRYWPEVSQVPGVKLVAETTPRYVFGRRLSSLFHAADVLRLAILRRSGGIFLDFDVFLVKSLDFYRRFEIALGVPPRQYLGTQVIVAHRSSRFLRLWADSYRWYRPDRWYYNAGELPTTDILLKQPSLVHVVPWDFGVHMLVVQLFGVCSAHWRALHAIHLLTRHRHYLVNDTEAPPQFDAHNIKTYNKTFGEMARYVLYGETRPIFDDRPFASLENLTSTNLSSMPKWCGDEFTEHQWKTAKPVPQLV